MKKILVLFFSIFSATTLLTAQNGCLQFFPTNEGSVLTTKTYDAQDNLLNTMTYRVNRVNDNMLNNTSDIGFTMFDNFNNVVSTASISTSCNDDMFSLRMVNRGYSPEVVKAMTNNTELIGYFLDYPNIFNNDLFSSSPFTMGGGEFTIEDNSDKKDKVNVKVYNRKLERSEKVSTPARSDSFDAYKITFDFDVTEDKKTTEYKGVEWYAPKYGIIRSETYDKNKNLLTKTELTTLREM